MIGFFMLCLSLNARVHVVTSLLGYLHLRKQTASVEGGRHLLDMKKIINQGQTICWRIQYKDNFGISLKVELQSCFFFFMVVFNLASR